MSRIGKMPVIVPDSVKVTISNRTVSVEGPKGKLQLDLPELTEAKLEDNQVLVTRESDEKRAKAMHGLARSLINNMVIGVEKGFVKKLEIHGVGFKAVVKGQVLNLNLGYSHEINHEIPAGINVSVENNTNITIEGADKAVVGKVAAEVRSYYPVEPYKGKGVRYSDEQVVRKQGKQVT
ncbi:MAG: 50S ribosomal protein L6 [Verrucomicrobiota bacterium]|nr:50S ribosomal protein L6 [Verrucomicrobiota bacterium]MEE2813538.1 50S ribosomal protein L6 [Verrucomicrobiota bacterium]